MTKLFLAAALAAIALPLPSAAASKPAATAQQTVAQLDHIRSTLHGAKGPVVVLIPGMSTPGAVWDDMAAKLASNHRVLVVEVNGFAGQRAAANERSGALDGIVSNIAADLKARGLKKAVIVGHSLGGLLAMKFALAHPQAAKSLVIVDALPFLGLVFDPNATTTNMEPRARQMRDTMIAQADQIRAIGAKGVTSDPGGNMSNDAATRVRISTWSMKAEPLVVGQAFYEDMMADLRSNIAAIKAPMTVLYNSTGDGAAATVRYSTDYAAKSDVRLIPVKDTGHFIQLDQPAITQAAIEAAAR